MVNKPSFRSKYSTRNKCKSTATERVKDEFTYNSSKIQMLDVWNHSTSHPSCSPKATKHLYSVDFVVVAVDGSLHTASRRGRMCLLLFSRSVNSREKTALREETAAQSAWAKADPPREAETSVHIQTDCLVCPCKTCWMSISFCCCLICLFSQMPYALWGLHSFWKSKSVRSKKRREFHGHIILASGEIILVFSEILLAEQILYSLYTSQTLIGNIYLH